MNKNKKITILVVAILSVGLVISLWNASTYALFSSDVYGTNYDTYTTGLLSIEAISRTENISLTGAIPISDEEGSASTPYIFTITNVGNIDYEFDIKLLSSGDEDTSIAPQYIKVKVGDDGEITTLYDLNNIIMNDVTLLAGESIDVTLRVWLSLDENNSFYNTPNTEIGKGFDSKIVTDGKAVYTNTNLNVKLVDYITALYNNASKSTVTNNNILYNYANDVNLMNDRLGSSLVEINSGNIRYFGANPSNYVDLGDVYEEAVLKNNWEDYFTFSTSKECFDFMDCNSNYSVFGFSDAASCSSGLPSIIQSIGFSSVDEFCGQTVLYEKGTPQLYRIIGLFKNVNLSDGTVHDLIKVVSADSIGTYSWDTSASDVNSGRGLGNWSESDLMKLLNPDFENNNDLDSNGNTITVNNSLWWNSDSGSCYSGQSNSTKTCDFTYTGINSKLHNKISSVVWNTTFLGGLYTGNTIEELYLSENDDSNDKWIGKVALMSGSDYHYAADLNKCSPYDFRDYSLEKCYSNDWIHNSKVNQWLLPIVNSDVGFSAQYTTNSVGGGGSLSARNDSVYNSYSVSPTFYLNSNVVVMSGTGTKTDPYVIR